MALIAVLWFAVLLSLVAAAFLSVARGSMRDAEGALRHARAEALAASGIELGIVMLLEPAHHGRLRTDGAGRAVQAGADRLIVSIQDVAGQIDLNEAEEPLLAALFASVGLPAERAGALAASVVDWRDPDEERRPAGAEAAEYRRAGLPHVPANRPFYAVSELCQVIGIDRALYARLAPLLTVFSGNPDVDVATASPPVRAALKTAGIDIDAAAPSPAAGAPRGTWSGDRPSRPASDSDTYAIRSEALMADGTRFVREAVVILTGERGQPYTIQSWDTPLGG